MPKATRIKYAFSCGGPYFRAPMPIPLNPDDRAVYKKKKSDCMNHNDNTSLCALSLTGPSSSSLLSEPLLTDHLDRKGASTSSGVSQDSGLINIDQVLSPNRPTLSREGVISCQLSSCATSESSPNQHVGNNTSHGVNDSAVGASARSFPVSPPSMSISESRKYRAERAQKDADYHRLMGKVIPMTPEPIQPSKMRNLKPTRKSLMQASRQRSQKIGSQKTLPFL